MMYGYIYHLETLLGIMETFFCVVNPLNLVNVMNAHTCILQCGNFLQRAEGKNSVIYSFMCHESTLFIKM